MFWLDNHSCLLISGSVVFLSYSGKLPASDIPKPAVLPLFIYDFVDVSDFVELVDVVRLEVAVVLFLVTARFSSTSP